MRLISKEEKPLKRGDIVVVIPRWMKTLFFLITMLTSLLLFSAPILLIIADALLPSAFLSAALSLSSFQSLSSHLSHYDFRYSLLDIPLLSIARSAIIFCVYSLCDGPRLWRGPYLAIAAVCSAASLVFVAVKGWYIVMMSGRRRSPPSSSLMEVAMFISSVGLAIGHVVVAYRISCRERRKLLIYNIDIEAIHSKDGWWELYIWSKNYGVLDAV